jgi:hypothetical protein
MPISHEPDCEGFSDARGRVEGICASYCWSHEACEPVREGDYLVCGECFHIFRTPEELVDALMATSEPGRQRPKAEDIFFCPHCIHDF